MTKEELFKLSGMIDQSALHPTMGIKELSEINREYSEQFAGTGSDD